MTTQSQGTCIKINLAVFRVGKLPITNNADPEVNLYICSVKATDLTDENEVVVMSTINSYRSLFVSANASCLFATYLTAGINAIYVISISSSVFKHKCLSRFKG